MNQNSSNRTDSHLENMEVGNIGSNFFIPINSEPNKSRCDRNVAQSERNRRRFGRLVHVLDR